MRLPSKLLGQVRVGVGVGAVVLGGCDLAEPVATTAAAEVAAEASEMQPQARPKHEPMLLSRHVVEAAEEVRTKSAPQKAPTIRAEVSAPQSVQIGDGKGFVPYIDPIAEGIIATAGPTPRPRIRRHKKQVDEPCETGKVEVGSPSGWDCPACGRG
ncbi:MAG: hypothetical protein AAF799_27835 [Myxococcota bacterium]